MTQYVSPSDLTSWELRAIAVQAIAHLEEAYPRVYATDPAGVRALRDLLVVKPRRFEVEMRAPRLGERYLFTVTGRTDVVEVTSAYVDGDRGVRPVIIREL